MEPEMIMTLVLALLFGVVIGSFLNVCIYRIPEKKTIVTERSHCMKCGYTLSWYDMIPVFSWLALGGKCRKCKTKLSPQYPLVEAANGILYVVVFAVCGIRVESVLFCLLVSALLVLSVIDFRTFEIPFGINVFIFSLGVIRVVLDYSHWYTYLIGLLAVSVPLELILLLSKGRAIGGGDVKLMGAAGLLLGWKCIVLAFLIGCIVRLASGGVAIFLVNAILSYYHVEVLVGINAISLLTSAILGIPGVCLLYALLYL